MQHFILSLAIILVATSSMSAQQHFTRSGKISFFSEAPLEKIEAVNSSATSVLDAESGKLEFAVLIKGFQFEKALMQEHFNENYLESGQFPKAIFKGEITNPDEVNFQKPGTYTANIRGELTIHGVTQPRDITATLVVKNGSIAATSKFAVAVADHEIEVPSVVRDKIAKTVEVTVEVNYEPFNK